MSKYKTKTEITALNVIQALNGLEEAIHEGGVIDNASILEELAESCNSASNLSQYLLEKFNEKELA